jgi:hypothetical protein
LRKNPKKIGLRIFQRFSSNPKSSTYHLYCKFQLLRYKPWSDEPSTSLGINADNDIEWINAWGVFCESEMGKTKIPPWKSTTEVERNETHIEPSDSDDDDVEVDDDEEADENYYAQEEWMRITCGNLMHLIDKDLNSNSISYWSKDREFYSYEELCTLKTWISTKKREMSDIIHQRIINDASGLNFEQRCAFEIVRYHLEQEDEDSQLLMRLEGTAGTGKSHVINAMCSLFNNHSYLIAAPTGRAAHNVCGVTLHSLLSLGTRVWKETLTN